MPSMSSQPHRLLLMPNHFLDLSALKHADCHQIIKTAQGYKKNHARLIKGSGRTLAMIFEKPSTRTRVSFDVAMRHLGGDVITLNAADMQIGRGESLSDTAKVLSRYVQVIMLRSLSHGTLLKLAESATVPVINGLTDHSHPCQVLADVLTLVERFESIADKKIAWIGDCNNVCWSWIEAAAVFHCKLVIACPESLRFENIPKEAQPYVSFTDSPSEAATNAHAIITDTWVSMGDGEVEQRRALLAPYQVTESLMQKALDAAVFLHCLPAVRGEEVTAEVIDGPHSAVWDEAENRLHVQKAILAWCLNL